MQFAGLKDLLKKKKEAKAATTSSSPLSSGASAETAAATAKATGSTDPYAAAVQSATAANRSIDSSGNADAEQQARPRDDRKRSRSPDHQVSSSTDALVAGSNSANSKKAEESGDNSMKAPRTDVAAPPRPTPLTRTVFEAQKETDVKALTALLARVSARMHADQKQVANTQSPSSKTAATVEELALPKALCDFLQKQHVGGQSTKSATSEEEAMAAEHDALQLALAECTENENSNHSNSESSNDGKTTSSSSFLLTAEARAETEKLVDLIHALWYLTTAFWKAAIQGSATETPKVSSASTTHQSPELQEEFGAISGWCYPVYLLSVHAIPDVLRFTCGREIAACLQSWQSTRRTQEGALTLLAHLLDDYEQLKRQHHDKNGSKEKKKDAVDTSIVPRAVREGLHVMLVAHTQQRKDFPAARQTYADLTLGNANWKLGLFSGGEVHMRRSVEKLERNRIAHLLNNETALRLLHAARELLSFAEQQWRARRGASTQADSVKQQFFLA